MKKNVMVRIVCLVVAAVVLGGAVTIAAVMGSPYETLKRALLDAATYQSATIDHRITMIVNGMVEADQKGHSVTGENSSLNYHFDSHGNQVGFTYSTDSLIINPINNEIGGKQWYMASVSPSYYSSSYRYYGGSAGFVMFTAEDRDSAQMRFMELVVDALVGDLKNNITMTSGDGVRIIRGTLTENQVPELVKAGIDMIIEESGGGTRNSRRDISFSGNEYVYETVVLSGGTKTVSTWKHTGRFLTPNEQLAWDYETFDFGNLDIELEFETDWGFSTASDGYSTFINFGSPVLVDSYSTPITRADYDDFDPMDVPMRSLTINYVHGEAEVDSSGNLLSIDVNSAATITNIFGDAFVVEIKGNARFSDIGASNPVCPVPGAEQILTPEYMRTRFGNEYMNLFFTVNEDGSINEESITSMHPGESAGRPWSINGSSGFTTTPLQPEQAPFPLPEPEPDDGAEIVSEDD